MPYVILKHIGILVLLTRQNHSAYWNPPRDMRSVDASFRLHERELTGALEWGTEASDGTMRGREQPIEIKGTYTRIELHDGRKC
jgi:hypothetical protein